VVIGCADRTMVANLNVRDFPVMVSCIILHFIVRSRYDSLAGEMEG
jgi:hypothetical protein